MKNAGMNEDERMDHKHQCSQVIVGNIPEHVSAKDLAHYLEARLGVVYRCRLKRFMPPLDAKPLFSCNEFEEISSYARSPCSAHAFVHFASARVAQKACKRAQEQKLCMWREGPDATKQQQCLRIQLAADELNVAKPPSANAHSWKLSNAVLEVGSLISRNEFCVSWKGPLTGASVELGAAHKKLLLLLSQWTCFRLPDSGEKIWMKCSYKLEFIVRDIWEVRKESRWDGTLTLVVQFRIPPRIFFRTEEDDIYHETSFELPDDADPWVRTLDFTPEKSLGRCHAYRVSVSPRQTAPFQGMLAYFKQLGLLKSDDLPTLRLPREVQSIHHRNDFFLVGSQRNIPFEIMFLVNAVVHKGIIKALSLTPGFYDLLDPSVTKTSQSVFALNHIYRYRNPIFDAQKRLEQVIDWSCSNYVPTSLAGGEETVEVRRFFVTPTKAYCLPPEVEQSNRVLRNFRSVADRFLRVSFLDENLHTMSVTMLNAAVSSFGRANREVTRTALYNRVREILLKGFVLCGRHYEFLAFSSSQLRDHSAWFFAKNEDMNVWEIRRWMGRFEMPNVAKYAARMGLCFSSSVSTVKFPGVEHLPDIIRNGYNFSDGIGKVSPMLALKCATILKLEDNPPCAYQIRYSGFKGVVVTWPTSQPDRCSLALRPSMNKFHSPHHVIEVVNWSRYLPCFLNRQIITLLSALNVPNQVFINLQDAMVGKLDKVLDDAKDAIEVLSSYRPGNMYSATLEMLSAGFHPLEEPHLYSVLHCIRASYLEEVLSKARIYVKDGRWLLGCMDELAVVEYGECFVQVSLPLEEDNTISANSRHKKQVITGKVIMAKNPCLHPGDIRILQAVDRPELHHLVDCLVMPQKGERPHSNEASGSDLDGDIYFVSWDPRLIPPGGKSWEPMPYAEHEERSMRKQKPRIEDLVEFFVTHMVNDHLGKICNAHVVHADQSELGALDPKCQQLAMLAAIAVDSPKTGRRVNLPAHLRPKMYPDFMDKQDRPCYHSEKILGYLFRKVKRAAEKEIELSSRLIGSPGTRIEQWYDKDLEMDGYKKYVADAWKLKVMYDVRLTALMDQFDVKAEGEVVSGHLTTFASKSNSRVKGDLNDRLKRMYTHLRDEFRTVFEQLPLHTGDDDQGSEKTEEEKQLHRDKELECKASAWYHVTYSPDLLREMKEGDPEKVLLLSFPWIAYDYLSRIKKRKKAEYDSYYNLIQSVGALSH